ncbi:hypothetical protein DSP71_19640 [Microbacterium sp. H6]|nr:hypothetical protein DSP71_19640 [Microbacterium sp. H6]
MLTGQVNVIRRLSLSIYTPSGATDAAAEWNAAYRGRRVVHPGGAATEVDPQMYEQMNTELGALRERLRSVPVDDRETWARVARHTAGRASAEARLGSRQGSSRRLRCVRRVRRR